MATFAQGSRAGLSYIAEATYGTTPATPTFASLPYTSHTIDLTKQVLKSAQIIPDRMPRVSRHGNRQVGGDIVCELQKGDWDEFIESVMFSSFATNVITPGTTLKSFSIEDGSLDINQFRLFTGVVVSKAAFDIKPNQMVNTTFTMLGQDMAVSTTTAATSLTAASTNSPFDGYSGAITLGDTGGALSSVATVTGVNFSIDNQMNPTFVVGSSTTPQLEYGQVMVDGTITAYFEDATLIDRFLNETQSAFQFSVDDPTGTNPYTFFFPKVKFNGASIPVSGPTSRVVTLPFEAIYDSVTGTNLKITRTNP